MDYFDAHIGRGFLAKLNEIGKLGKALETHHGIDIDPAELMRVLGERSAAGEPMHFVLGGHVLDGAGGGKSALSTAWPWEAALQAPAAASRAIAPASDSSNEPEDDQAISEGEPSDNAPEAASANVASENQLNAVPGAPTDIDAPDQESGTILTGNPKPALGAGSGSVNVGTPKPQTAGTPPMPAASNPATGPRPKPEGTPVVPQHIVIHSTEGVFSDRGIADLIRRETHP